MMSKFIRERDLVERLMRLLQLDVDGYEDPNASGLESGADVTAIRGAERIGIQVTVAAGGIPGESIAVEKRLAKEAQGKHGGVYAITWQTQPLAALTVAIKKKAATDIAGFDQVWLLISCGIPETGALAATLVPPLGIGELNAATSETLLRSKYARAYIHPIIGLENALYQWTPNSQWVELVDPSSEPIGMTFWDIQKLMRKRTRSM